MKTKHFFFLLVTITLASCSQPQMPAGPKDELGYYIYNPEDTIDNLPFYYMLCIDSGRVEYRKDNSASQGPTIYIGGYMRELETTLEKRRREDSLVYAEVETAWYEMMGLVSQGQFDVALKQYIRKDAEIGIALSTSTHKFNLDYFVVGKLLFLVFDEYEAVEKLVKLFEYDKLLTEGVLAFSMAEGGSGYVPPHYAFLLDRLCNLYLYQDDWEKVEALLEPYREATYLLSDDTLSNEQDILDLKLRLCGSQFDMEGAKTALFEYKDFLVHHAVIMGEDLSVEIEKVDETIRRIEERREIPRIRANA